jgi:hypothetical protein
MQRPRARESFSAEREFNTTIVFFLGQEILTNVHKLNVTFFFSNLFLLQLYVDIYLCMKTVISMYHIYLAEFFFSVFLRIM